MNLQQFLTQATTKTFWDNHPSICFTSTAYPLVFFRFLFARLKNDNVLPGAFSRIFVQDNELAMIQANLCQTILGMQSFFWLGDIGQEKSTKAMQHFYASLYSYKGPNHVAFFIDAELLDTKKSDALKIQLPATVAFQDADALIMLLGINLEQPKKDFFKKFFDQNVTHPLDTCCMLASYLQLLSVKTLDQASGLLSLFTESNPSLFQLSEHFFSKNAKAFFATWEQLSTTYPDIFWITYWNEQLWRAIHTISFLQKKDFVSAKKMSYRLPSRFLHKDWRNISAAELINAYTFLYGMDYALKKGSTFCFCELLYMRYFSGSFAPGKTGPGK